MEEFNEQISSSYGNLVDKLTDWLNAIILQAPNLLLAIVVAALAYFFSRYVKKMSVKACSKFTDNRTVLNLVANLSTVIFGFFILFLILSIFDLSSTINKILATAGVLGLAVGLALQDPMTIDLRVTTLMTPTGQIVTIPNKDVIQSPLENYTSSGVRRVDVSCGVSYGDDLDMVEKTAVSAIENIESRIKERPIDLVFQEFGNSSINFTLRYWIPSSSQLDYLKEQSKAIKLIKSAFDEKDIMIPFPITTLDFGIRGGTPLNKVMSLSTQESNGTINQTK